MENEQNVDKKLSVSTIIIFVVLIAAIIGFFVLKTPKNGDVEPFNEENTATTTDSVATSTPETPANLAPAQSNTAPAPTNSVDTGVKVIQGDGFTATLKPVYGEAPVINSFVLANKSGSTCRFSWDVSKGKKCDFLNAETKTGVKDVGVSGGIQTSDAGKYILKCYGDGGKSITSEVVSC